MRKVLFIFITLLVFVSACTERKRETSSLLQLAEEMMRTAPDTALYLLQNLKECNAVSSEDSIYGELLLLEAQAKNGMKLTDTIVPRSLSSYYLSRQDTLMHARSLRLSAVTYRNLGRYDEAVAHYNAVIALAKAVDGKRLLGDVYSELAKVHYDDASKHQTEPPHALIDSLLYLTEQIAEEVKDTVLWIKSLRLHGAIAGSSNRYDEWEKWLLLASDLSKEIKDVEKESQIALNLSIMYAKLGKKEKSLSYAHRNLVLRKESIPEYLYCLTLSNAYQRIGEKDSTDYYFKMGYELKAQKEKDALHQQNMQERNIYFVSFAIFLIIGYFVFTLIRKHCLHQKDKRLLQQKDNKILLMQREIDTLSSDTLFVFDKIHQIIEDHLYKSRSDLRMEEVDWQQLQIEMDKQWNNAVTCLQKEYHLKDTEVRLLCLNLTEFPTAHIPFLFNRTVNTIYVKNRNLCKKLGIKHQTDNFFKEDFKNFIRNRE